MTPANLKTLTLKTYIIKNQSNNELKEIDIKNHMSYYFDDIIKIEDFDLDNLLVKKSYGYFDL